MDGVVVLSNPADTAQQPDVQSGAFASLSKNGVVPHTAPYIIAVCHQKGGVAKTTTVSALASIFAGDKHPTLIVDLDPTANLTASFGINPAKVRRSVADILLGNDSVASVSLHTRLNGLDLLPSNADMTTVSRYLYLRPRYEVLLKTALNQSNLSAYEYVFLDCPPAVLALTVAALTAANLAIIPIQCEYYSLQALDTVFKTISNVRTKTNPGLSYRLLVAMFDHRGSLHTRVLEMIRERYQHAMFETIIGFDTKLRESQLAGIPITVFAPKSRSTLQYQNLARELYTYVQKQSLPEQA